MAVVPKLLFGNPFFGQNPFVKLLRWPFLPAAGHNMTESLPFVDLYSTNATEHCQTSICTEANKLTTELNCLSCSWFQCIRENAGWSCKSSIVNSSASFFSLSKKTPMLLLRFIIQNAWSKNEYLSSYGIVRPDTKTKNHPYSSVNLFLSYKWKNKYEFHNSKQSFIFQQSQIQKIEIKIKYLWHYVLINHTHSIT